MYMEQHTKDAIAASVQTFKLPRYDMIPDMGLYLEQTAAYISECLAPLGNFSITGSMISNYVKKGIVQNPVKKLYNRTQIIYLIFIALAKSVLSLEDIQLLIRLQKRTYDTKVAYEYFCQEFENILSFVFGLKDSLDAVGHETSDEKTMLRNTIITVAHKIYLEKCLSALREKEEFCQG